VEAEGQSEQGGVEPGEDEEGDEDEWEEEANATGDTIGERTSTVAVARSRNQ
jgi:hypothetical protein